MYKDLKEPFLTRSLVLDRLKNKEVPSIGARGGCPTSSRFQGYF